MPADDLYWSPIDMESEESNNFSKSYIDPWDLENYAYMREHLDSLEVSSIGSSPEAQLESSSTFSYIPGSSKNVSKNQKYDSLVQSERGTSNYASIDEIGARKEETNKKRRQSEVPYRSARYERDYEDCDIDENPYEEGIKDSSLMYVYETRGRLRKIALPADKNSRTRSYSYSCGDYGYEPDYHAYQIYSRLDESKPKREVASSPIYDDIKTNPTPNNFGLSKYGHLKIDYSYSWNNLNKYIYN